MSGRDYRLETVILEDGELGCRVSQQYKDELMTPNLRHVAGPLSRKIWRCTKFEYLEKMLRERELFFPRVDTLGDPREGLFNTGADTYFHEDPVLQDGLRKLIRETSQRLFFVSCWRMCEHEDEVLWHKYGRPDDSVIMQTDLSSLCVLRPVPVNIENYEMIPKYFAGEVSYVNFEEPSLVSDVKPIHMFKKTVYESDAEFRAVIELWNLGWSCHDHSGLPGGVTVPISPGVFFQSFIPKFGNPALTERLESLLNELGYKIPVRPSQL